MSKFIRFRVAFYQYHVDSAEKLEIACYDIETESTFVGAIERAYDELVLDNICPSQVDCVLCDIVGDSKNNGELPV